MNAESGPRRRADIEAKNPMRVPSSRLQAAAVRAGPILGVRQVCYGSSTARSRHRDAKARRCRVLLRLKASSGLSRGRIAEANVPRVAADFQASHPELSGVSTTWSIRTARL